MEISPFDAKIIEMLSRIDEGDPLYGRGENDKRHRIQGKPGKYYFRDINLQRLLRLRDYIIQREDSDGKILLVTNKSNLPQNIILQPDGNIITKDGKMKFNRFLRDIVNLKNDYFYNKKNKTVEEADIPLPTAPSVGDMPEGPQNLVTGEMPGPDASQPIGDEEIDDEEEKETPEGIREYIDMIRRALTLDPNTLELSDFQKKALYTSVTAKNAEDKLKVYNKILNDYDPIETPQNVPDYDPYATTNS